MRFPYPPGVYGPDSVVDGSLVAGDPRLEAWFQSKGIDWTLVYRVHYLGEEVIVYAYAIDSDGHRFLDDGELATEPPLRVSV